MGKEKCCTLMEHVLSFEAAGSDRSYSTECPDGRASASGLVGLKLKGARAVPVGISLAR